MVTTADPRAFACEGGGRTDVRWARHGLAASFFRPSLKDPVAWSVSNSVESALGFKMLEKVTDASVELSAFCRSEYPKLASMLALYCGDRELAQDLAQETIVRVIQNWKKVSRLPAPSAWCRKVAINTANSWFRRVAANRRATRRLEGRVGRSHDHPDSANAVAVRAAVANLPARQKAVIVLRFYADLPVEEVAQEMRCEQGTVWALTNQAIASLRKAGLVDLKEAADVK